MRSGHLMSNRLLNFLNLYRKEQLLRRQRKLGTKMWVLVPSCKVSTLVHSCVWVAGLICWCMFTVCSLGAYWLVTGPDAPGCSGWPPLQGVGALPRPSSPEVVPIWSDWVPDQESLVACASCVDPNSDLHLLYGHYQCSNLHLDIFFLATVERYSAGSSTSTRCAAMDIYWVLPASVCLPSWSPIWLSLLDTLPLCYPWSTSQGLY